MTRRLTSRSLAGTSRKLVAVGTSRLASMLATMRAPAPRIGLARRLLGRTAASAAGGGRLGCGGRARGGRRGRLGHPGLRCGISLCSPRRSPASSRSPRRGRPGTARASRRRARRSGRARSEQARPGGGVVSHGVDRTGASIHHSDRAPDVDRCAPSPRPRGGGHGSSAKHSAAATGCHCTTCGRWSAPSIAARTVAGRDRGHAALVHGALGVDRGRRHRPRGRPPPPAGHPAPLTDAGEAIRRRTPSSRRPGTARRPPRRSAPKRRGAPPRAAPRPQCPLPRGTPADGLPWPSTPG